MTPSDPLRLLHKAWEYPLFDALYGRRSRRFGLGFEVTEGPFRYKSQRPPLPLSDIEEALLVAAGVGFSGIALWDQSRPLPYRAGDGRTFPSTSRGRRTALFFTNDQGVHVIDPAAPSPGKLRAVETPDEREKVLSLYRESRKTLQQGRLDYSSSRPAALGAQSHSFEYAGVNAVYASMRCNRFLHQPHRPIRRSAARAIRGKEQSRHEHR